MAWLATGKLRFCIAAGDPCPVSVQRRGKMRWIALAVVLSVAILGSFGRYAISPIDDRTGFLVDGLTGQVWRCTRTTLECRKFD